MRNNKSLCRNRNHQDHEAGHCRKCNCGESEIIGRKENIWYSARTHERHFQTELCGIRVKPKKPLDYAPEY